MIRLPIDRNNVETVSLYDIFKNLTDDEKETIYLLIENDCKIEKGSE